MPVGAPRTENRAPIVAHVTKDVLYTRNVYEIAYKCAKCGHSCAESKVSLSKDYTLKEVARAAAIEKGSVAKYFKLILKEVAMEYVPPSSIEKALATEGGELLAQIRELVKEADPDIVEEWKWMGTACLVPQRGGLHWRDLQASSEIDLLQGRLSEGSQRSLQL